MDTTIRWRVYELVKESALSRVGLGLYQLKEAKEYVPDNSSRTVKIGRFIKANFPTTNYCVWESGIINEFAQHLSAYPFILVDVERDVSESIYYQLKEEFKGVFLRPNETLINDLLPDFKLPIIVRHLTTESPINEIKGISTVTLEKLLADVFCDVEFNFLAGSECRAVFTNAYYKYTVNENKMFRYAARKGRKEDLQKYVREINSNQR